MSFNVLYEKWIPISDGSMYSLCECLEQAHELERISCPSPLETYAVHRFLCTFVMDALQLPNKKARMELLRQGRFDMAVFDAYIKQCEAEGTSFDLFDEKRPFMQAGYDSEQDEEPKSVAVMLLAAPSGTNHIFLDHRMEGMHRLCNDEFLRNLLTLYTFCPAGGSGYPKSVNGTPCLYMTVLGDTLFDTIVKNSISQKEAGNLHYGKPCWRDMAKRVIKEESASCGLLEGMTWQPRRITAVEAGSGGISQVYYTSGRMRPTSLLWRDPHVAYVADKDNHRPLLPQSGRALWRDLGAIVATRETGTGKRPLVIETLKDECIRNKVVLTGLITDGNAKLFEIVHEEVIIPNEVLKKPECGEEFYYALDFVEKVYRALIDEAVASKLAKKNKKGKTHVKEAVMDAINSFLASVRDYLLEQYAGSIIRCETDEAFVQQREALFTSIRSRLEQMFDRLVLRMGFDAQKIVVMSVFKKHVMKRYAKERKG